MSLQEDFSALASITRELAEQLGKMTEDRDVWYKRAKAQENCEHYVEMPPELGEGDWLICNHMKGTGLLEKLCSLQEQVKAAQEQAKAARANTLAEVVGVAQQLCHFVPDSGSGTYVIDRDLFVPILERLAAVPGKP